jgi:hypothetical protein
MRVWYFSEMAYHARQSIRPTVSAFLPTFDHDIPVRIRPKAGPQPARHEPLLMLEERGCEPLVPLPTESPFQILFCRPSCTVCHRGSVANLVGRPASNPKFCRLTSGAARPHM